MITPNRLTAARIILTLLVIVFLLTPSLTLRTLAFFAFVAAGITDYYDGHLARSRKMVTSLGKILDPIADKLLILSTLICYVLLGLFSIWWIIPMAIREVGVTGLRFVLLGKGVVVAAERLGKIKFVTQIVAIGFCYAWLMAREHLWTPPPVLLDARPLVVYGSYMSLLVATALTLWSGASFLAANRRKIW